MPKCILWEGSINSGGYGQKMVSGKKWQAHRFVYKHFFGPIPNGLCVLHQCDNRRCINPDHLFLGTRAINCADKVSKNRQATGEKCGSSKLTEKDVISIRENFSSGETQCSLAERFRVNQSQISKVINNKHWRHI